MTDSHDNPSESIPPGATASTDPERSVEEQRADLADTVAALAAKADVPARCRTVRMHSCTKRKPLPKKTRKSSPQSRSASPSSR